MRVAARALSSDTSRRLWDGRIEIVTATIYGGRLLRRPKIYAYGEFLQFILNFSNPTKLIRFPAQSSNQFQIPHFRVTLFSFENLTNKFQLYTNTALSKTTACGLRHQRLSHRISETPSFKILDKALIWRKSKWCWKNNRRRHGAIFQSPVQSWKHHQEYVGIT